MIADLTKIVSIKHRFTTAYNPRCNRLTKRFNKTLVQTLENSTKYQPSTWEDSLPAALWHYRTKVHATTKLTPFEVMYGMKPPTTRPDVLPDMNNVFNHRQVARTKAMEAIKEKAKKIERTQEGI